MKNAIIIVLFIAVAMLLMKGSTQAPVVPESEVSATTTSETATTTSTAPLVPGKTITIPAKKPATTATTPAPAQSYPLRDKDGTYLIHYTDKGFTPASLEIARGSSVRFINSSNKAMRIGTTDLIDRQPSNEIAQSTTVGKGGVYALTFNTAFTYGYQNKNNPGDTGQIIVK